MASIKEIRNKIRSIDWSDINDWAGGKIMARGESYFNSGHVSKLRISPKGLIAKVAGTKPYLTLVSFDDEGELQSVCTCPYRYNCKHGVATLLAYCDAIKFKKTVTTTKSNDPDIAKVLSVSEDEDEYYGDEEDYYEDEEYEEPETAVVQAKSAKKGSAKSDIETFLDKQTKKSLKELLLKFSKEYPDISSALLDKARVSGGKVQSLVTAMRREISNITSSPVWQNHWDNRGELADFSRVKSVMTQLFSQGQFQAVIDINKELIHQANSYVETCDDDGDASSQISECVEIGFKALAKSDSPDFDKLIFAINTGLEDEYDVFSGVSVVIDSISDKASWSKVADKLNEKLSRSKGSGDNFSRNYKRDLLSNALVNALENSSRHSEILPLCQKEAKATGSWERYVSLLNDNKHYDEARKAAEQGIKQTSKKYPGIAKSLQDWIVKLASRSKDYGTVLKIKIDEFLDHPSIASYEILLKASQKTKNHDQVKAWSLKFLETGKSPAIGQMKTSYSPKRSYQKEFPQFQVLIDIAEKEKDPESVFHWYKLSLKKSKQNYWYRNFDQQVAKAISGKYPNESIKIWKKLAEEQIALTKPSAYDVAVGYLAQVQKISKKQKIEAEWKSYIGLLAAENKRKPRFIKSLRSLNREKLI